MRILAFTFHEVSPEALPRGVRHERPGGVPGGEADPFYAVSESQFEALLAGLRRLGFHTATSRDFAAWQRGETQLPERTVLLTFDDGYRSHIERVVPLLVRYRMSGTFFVPPGSVGKPGYMGWEELKKLLFLGMEIGSHGLTHRPLTRLSLEELQKEVLESRRVLEERLGTAVRSMAAPGGFWNPAVAEAVRRAGYEAAWCSTIGTNGRQTLPLGLRRVVVRQPFLLDRLLSMAEGSKPSFWWAAGQQQAIRLLKWLLGVYWYEQLKRRLVPNA